MSSSNEVRRWQPGDVAGGHVLLASGQWVPIAQQTHVPVPAIPVQIVQTCEDNTTRLFNIGRSRTIVFKGEKPKPVKPKKHHWWDL